MKRAQPPKPVFEIVGVKGETVEAGTLQLAIDKAAASGIALQGASINLYADNASLASENAIYDRQHLSQLGFTILRTRPPRVPA